ncbi:MAG: GTPase ObgE [Nitrospirae bacterium]|nr:MAG: GTPase ObgE [Nitrospirota bacterium]
MFIDYARIYVKAGDGGSGACSFRREKYVPRGGPDGGDGGCGGSVYLIASSRVSTLLDFRYQRQYEAEPGGSGQRANRQGRTGADIRIPVPVGTVVKDADTGELLADFTKEGETIMVARGGRGGRGNARFATATNRAPRHIEPGRPGEERWLVLELKLLADVGLVGFPNAGKSTLISAISAARPEIADYPFTTLRPHLGVVHADDFQHFVVADIPGLIEGAHEGRGLGHRFLRHIQRTALLLFLVDISVWNHDDPVQTVHTLRHELEAYDTHLTTKPFLVAGTKIDSQGDGQKLHQLQAWCEQHAIPFFPISAVTGAGLNALIAFLGREVAALHHPCVTPC